MSDKEDSNPAPSISHEFNCTHDPCTCGVTALLAALVEVHDNAE